MAALEQSRSASFPDFSFSFREHSSQNKRFIVTCGMWSSTLSVKLVETSCDMSVEVKL